MFFRDPIIQEAKSYSGANEKILSPEIAKRIQSHLKEVFDYYQSNKQILSYITDSIFGEEPEVILLRDFLKKDNIVLDDLCKLISAIGDLKIKGSNEKLIEMLKTKIDEAIVWSRNGIFKTIALLEKLKKNNPFLVKYLITNQEYALGLEYTIEKIFLDWKQTLERSMWEHAMEKYWEKPIHWEKIFKNPKYASEITWAISIVSDIEGLTTEENCRYIYNIHETKSEQCIIKFGEELRMLNNEAQEYLQNLGFLPIPIDRLEFRLRMSKKLSDLFMKINLIFPEVAEIKSETPSIYPSLSAPVFPLAPVSIPTPTAPVFSLASVSIPTPSAPSPPPAYEEVCSSRAEGVPFYQPPQVEGAPLNPDGLNILEEKKEETVKTSVLTPRAQFSAFKPRVEVKKQHEEKKVLALA